MGPHRRSSARRVAVETAYGPIRVKIGRRGETIYNAWPEFDDCQRAAAEKGVAVKEMLAAALAAWRARQPWEPMSTSKRVSVITTPIYYVNDVPHVGHAYTTIAADTLARARRLGGQDVFFLTGTDEHGQNIERIARERGISEQEHCDVISAAFRSLWERYDIRYDRFIRTTEDVHRRGVLKLWARLREAKTPDGRDAVYLGKYSGWYCPRCEGFKDEEELRQPDNVCPDHERPCEWTEEENFFFRLSAYEAWLRETIESDRAADPAGLAQERDPGRHQAGAQGLQRQPRPGEVGHPGARAARPRPLRLGGRAQQLHHRPRLRGRRASPTGTTGRAATSGCTCSARTSSASTASTGRPSCTRPASRCRRASSRRASSRATGASSRRRPAT